MSETNKLSALSKYRNIFGNAKETIQAIQNFIDANSLPLNENNSEEAEEPAASINRIINSTADEDTTADIKKIINNL